MRTPGARMPAHRPHHRPRRRTRTRRRPLKRSSTTTILEGARMNFIIIMNDTLRPDYLSAYGNTWVRTPHAAAFAKTAAVFDKAYVGSFPTIPNRTDLFTGRFGEPFHPWLPLAFDEITLPDLLRQNGYVTQLICDTPHLINGGHNFDFPFNAWDFIRGQEIDRYGMDSAPVTLPFKNTSAVPPQHLNRSVAQYLRNIRGQRGEEDCVTHRTCQTVLNWLARNARRERFFLWVDAFDPHEPNLPPQRYVDPYDPGYTGDKFLMHVPDPDKLTEAEIRNVVARYAATVTFVDRCFGRILQALDDLGLAHNTCVIWLSDHGTYLNEHGLILTKTCVFDEVCRTVLMIRTPKREAAGHRFDEFVQPADFAPTLLDMAGIPVPERMQ
ncbi:MAG: sulfatase, partial [Planctomycetes bacterium]|nr:sulfatase [Planctomycetota bacterium]